ncbi:MAG: triose-phosphate isomerase [Rhizobiaceae bacterium]|nr:triose-phosphate isomerase [Rhizobiaceae bacterium]
MSARIRPVLAGNWKMNGTSASLPELQAIAAGAAGFAGLDFVVCLPATLIARAQPIVAGAKIALGGQDCHSDASGAHTGDVSADMLRDAGASHVIVGHSERRTDHGETSDMVAAKAKAAWAAGLKAIICIGETRAEREAGATLDILSQQIEGSVPEGATQENTLLAYEPVWAIGTGLTPTADDVGVAHAHIRARLEAKIGEPARSIPLLYGGSVKSSNAGELMSVADVDGALVGGASLKAGDFLAIASAF